MPAQSEILFFKFGSVVGFTNAPLDTFGPENIKFDPSGKAYTGTGSTTYGQITAGNYHNVSDNAYHTLANVKAGKGDPCRLVGMTTAEIQAMTTDIELYTREAVLKTNGTGGWRLPTNIENAHYTGLAGAKIGSYANGNGKSPGAPNVFPFYANSSGTWTHIEGTPAAPARGYFPIGGTPATAANNVGRTLNSSVDWLPAAGYCYLSTGGGGNRGSSGYYWSSTRNGSSTGTSLTFDNIGVQPCNSINSAYGFAVRCVPVQ